MYANVSTEEHMHDDPLDDTMLRILTYHVKKK
jgi:hypothetical protein